MIARRVSGHGAPDIRVTLQQYERRDIIALKGQIVDPERRDVRFSSVDAGNQKYVAARSFVSAAFDLDFISLRPVLRAHRYFANDHVNGCRTSVYLPFEIRLLAQPPGASL